MASLVLLYLTFPRYIKPPSYQMFGQIEQELFDGDLTEDDDDQYVYCVYINTTNI